MSLVIAQIKDGVVYMGADTQGSIGANYKRNSLSGSNRKIILMPHGVLVGMTGSVQNGEILCAHKEWFDDLEHEKLTKEFLVTRIVPKFYNELKMYGALKKETPADSETTLMFAQEDRLFTMRDDFSVTVVPMFDAIGCGFAAAVAVYETDKTSPVKDKMLLALRLASEHDATISPPFVFIDTKQLEFETVAE